MLEHCYRSTMVSPTGVEWQAAWAPAHSSAPTFQGPTIYRSSRYLPYLPWDDDLPGERVTDRLHWSHLKVPARIKGCCAFGASSWWTDAGWPDDAPPVDLEPDHFPLSCGDAMGVQSVGLAAPAEFIVSGSPVTSRGILSLDWAPVPAGWVLSGPASGPDAAPTFKPPPAGSSLILVRVTAQVSCTALTKTGIAGSATFGINTFTLTTMADADSFQVGDEFVSSLFPAGTVVSSIDATTGVITVSTTATGSGPGTADITPAGYSWIQQKIDPDTGAPSDDLAGLAGDGTVNCLLANRSRGGIFVSEVYWIRPRSTATPTPVYDFDYDPQSSGASAPLTLTPPTDSDFGLQLQQSSPTQTGNLLQFADSGGSPGAASINAGGDFTNPGPVGSTGTDNERFGNGALQSLATGIGNTAMGVETLQSLTSGATNVAIGNRAGKNITYAGQNSLVGYYSGTSLTSGSRNTLVGYRSGYYGTTGRDNVAIGDSSMASLTTGGFNTAVGGNALYYAGAGSQNTAIGWLSGNSAGGSNNTFLGSSTTMTGGTFSFSSAVGFGSAVTADHQIMLGTSSETVELPGQVHFANPPTGGGIAAFSGITTFAAQSGGQSTTAIYAGFSVTIVTSVSAGSDTKLPNTGGPSVVFVLNFSGNFINVWPPVGGTLNNSATQQTQNNNTMRVYATPDGLAWGQEF